MGATPRYGPRCVIVIEGQPRVPEIAPITSAQTRGLADMWKTAPGLRGFLSTVGHKKIGIRYLVTAFLFLAVGGLEALVIEDISRRADVVRAAAAELGVSRASLYRMLARFRAVGTTSALLPRRLGRPAGALSLDSRRVELVVREIESFCFELERPRLSQLIERIAQRCHAAVLRAPNCRTVRERIDALDDRLTARTFGANC